MFSNKTHYHHEHIGRINISKAAGAFHFSNKTTGIALKYVVKGRERYTINRKTIELQQGQFILLPDGTDYKAHGHDQYRTEGLCVDVRSKILRDNLTPDSPIFHTIFNCQGSTTVGQFASELACSQDLTEDVCASSILLFESHIGELYKQLDDINAKIGSQVKKARTRDELSVKLILAKEFVCAHYRKKIPLEQLASTIGISRYHLTRLFKQSFGLTPLAMQEQLRMENAQLMVKDSSVSLTEIAYTFGYTDLAAFSKCFKQYWQYSPSEFR